MAVEAGLIPQQSNSEEVAEHIRIVVVVMEAHMVEEAVVVYIVMVHLPVMEEMEALMEVEVVALVHLENHQIFLVVMAAHMAEEAAVELEVGYVCLEQVELAANMAAMEELEL